MNLLLLQDSEITSLSGNNVTASITDPEKVIHIKKILKLAVGDRIRAGIIDGNWGDAVITSEGKNEICITLEASLAPPEPPPISVVIALPRPPVTKRLLINLASFGIKKIAFFQSAKVEKSFWQSPVLRKENIERLLIEGLEQGKDTTRPVVNFYKKLHTLSEKHFEDSEYDKVIFHPSDNPNEAAAQSSVREKLIAIGPEGGFTPEEVERFESQGFVRKSLGLHTLKVEAAVYTAIGSLIG